MKSFKLEDLVKRYGMQVSGLSSRMIQNPEIAKEAAQEAWYEVIKSINTFNGDSSISTWIYSVAKRTIWKYVKKEHVFSSQELNNHFSKEKIIFSGNEENREEWIKNKCDWCLTAFCHCLTNEARLIFILREVNGLDFEDISEIMEMNKDNIRQALSRSRKKVKNFMNRNCYLFNPQSSCKCRIQNEIKAINIDKVFNGLSETSNLFDFYKKFDKTLPRKNFWENLIEKVVTN